MSSAERLNSARDKAKTKASKAFARHNPKGQSIKDRHAYQRGE